MEKLDFWHKKQKHIYHRYLPSGGEPPRPAVGDLRKRDDGTYLVFDDGRWITAQMGAKHPVLADIVLSDDGDWKSLRWFQKKQKCAKRAMEEEPASRPAKRVQTDGIAPTVDEIQPSTPHPENAWFAELANRYARPPLSFYPHSLMAETVLTSLATSSLPIPRMHGAPIDRPPNFKDIWADLTTLRNQQIPAFYLMNIKEDTSDLGSWQLFRLRTPALTRPFQEDDEICAVFDVIPTPLGVGALDLGPSFSAMIEAAVPGSVVFQDYRYHMDRDQVESMFLEIPAVSRELNAQMLMATGTVAQRKRTNVGKLWKARVDETMGKPYASSVYTPLGFFSDIHYDSPTAGQVIVHVSGIKLWFLWPASEANLRWWGGRSPAGRTAGKPLLLDGLANFEGLSVIYLDRPQQFFLRPFTFHACLSLTESAHTGAMFVISGLWEDAVLALDCIAQQICAGSMSTQTALWISDGVEKRAGMWLKAKGTEAAEYFEAWWKKVDKDVKAAREAAANHGSS